MDSSPPSAPAPIQALDLFLVWAKIGCTSFGGGPVTQYLIQENFIYRRKWLSPEEYATILGMSQVAPGINLIAIAILIGKRLAGGLGIALSLAGLILPSVIITVAMTAAYVGVGSLPRVQASLRMAFAAILGISLATNWRNVRPIFQGRRKRGPVALASALAILVGTALVYALLSPAVALLYVAGGLLGALSNRLPGTKADVKGGKE